MTKLVLEAKKRSVFGRKVSILRKEGILPGNIYGKKVKSLAIQVPSKNFQKVYEDAGETNLIQLKVDKEPKLRPVLATNLQIDAVTDAPLHIDFHQVDLKEKVTAAVPIEVKGESLAVKEKGGILITLLDEVKVEALPQDLPDKLVVDISQLEEFDQGIFVKDLKVEKNVSVLAEPNETVVMVQEPKKEEEAPPEEEEAPPEEEEAPPEEEEAPKAEAEPEKKEKGEEQKKKATKPAKKE